MSKLPTLLQEPDVKLAMVSPVAKDEPISLPTTDGLGWSRKPAPEAGILVEFEYASQQLSVFVPWSEVDRLRKRK